MLIQPRNLETVAVEILLAAGSSGNEPRIVARNLVEANLARPRVKAADFHGKAAYLTQRECEHQPAYLCTMTMTDNIDSKGVARYPVGQWPILDPTAIKC